MLKLTADFNDIQHGVVTGLRSELTGTTENGAGAGARILLTDDEGHACWGTVERADDDLIHARIDRATWRSHKDTHDDLLRLAEDEAFAMLGVTLAAAFDILDSGQLAGTIAEAELRMLRFLLDD
jgi:hypothetical protein